MDAGASPIEMGEEVGRDRGGPRQPLLLVRNLKKYFPIRGGFFGRTSAWVQAVECISFSIAKRETLGVVGESGCGKSTAARLLMRLMKADAGEVIFDGEPIGSHDGISVRELRRNVQMVFQDSYASLNPRLPIEESVAFTPRVHGLSARAARERARALLGRVGLEPDLFARRYPHELSGGQRQRVNIGSVDAIYERPRHPYTRALLSAMPSLDPERRTTAPPLTGDPPNPINPPSGCRFRTRCAFAEGVCEGREPDATLVDERAQQFVACHMSDPGSGHSRAAPRVADGGLQ